MAMEGQAGRHFPEIFHLGRQPTGEGRVGILTFHCADNFGAMLQAYGLKQFLCGSGIQADVVRYEPPYMTGRHWLFPYLPFQRHGGLVRNLAVMGCRFLENLRAGPVFFRRRANMRRFRREYLCGGSQPRILFRRGLSRLRYRCYIVGSDQIWNPAITYGLRGEYFGCFTGMREARAIAYAASLGSSRLPAKYDGEFARLVANLSAVSLRERTAIPYVRQFYPGDVAAVTDPVFFLGREAWQQVEAPKARQGYILAYFVEENQEMAGYLERLSQTAELPVLALGAFYSRIALPFPVDAAAGPAEFLSYLHHADYVVTNSFHAAAFSIIYQKRFLVFAHSRVNTRLQDLLQLCGLEGRLFSGGESDIHAAIDWDRVGQRIGAAVEASREFLLSSIAGREA